MQNFNIRTDFLCLLKVLFFNNLPLLCYGIVYCILGMVAWLKEINMLCFLGFSYTIIEQILFQHTLLYRGLFQTFMFTTVVTYKIEFYGQFALFSDTQSVIYKYILHMLPLRDELLF